VRRVAYGALVGEPARKRPFGRPRLRWEDNIKIDFKEMCVGHGLYLSDSEYGQLAGCCEHGNEHLGFINSGEFTDWLRNC
jgi:hypothetical protein